MKRIIAIAGVAILGILYIVTIFAAIFDSTSSLDFFRASVAATIIVPVLLYAYMAYYRYVHRDEIELKRILDEETINNKDSQKNEDNPDN